MFRDPISVGTVWRGNVIERASSHGRCGSRILPLVDFGVAIAKRKPAGPAMVTSRNIDNIPLRRLIGPAAQGTAPLAIIDAVGTFINEYDRHGRPRLEDIGHLLVDSARAADSYGVGTVKPTEHGHAPHPRKRL